MQIVIFASEIKNTQRDAPSLCGLSRTAYVNMQKWELIIRVWTVATIN